MTFFVDIKPIQERALEGECSIAILKAIAHEHNRLRGISNFYQLSLLMDAEFLEAEIRRAARILEFSGFISSHVEAGTGDLKNIELTDTGWAASGIGKPFWMGGDSFDRPVQ